MKKLSQKKLEGMRNRAYQNKLRSFKKMKAKLESKPEYVRMRNLQKIKVSNRKVNVFRDSLINTDRHERTKYEVYRYLRKLGYHIITEAKFEPNGCRADLYILDSDVCIEILESEKPQDCLDKVENYPVSQTIMLETKKGIKFNLNYLEKVL